MDNSADINIEDEDGYKPVHLTKSASVALFLIELAPELSTEDINRKNYMNKKTLLHWAVLKQDEEDETETVNLVKKLISRGAELDVRDEDGKTPLQLATEKGKISTVECLLHEGATTNVTMLLTMTS